ncbi:MAG: T9SS type A sorting domain-containing protein [Ignavibacteriae bacterium]|nr:T9SS type A sorting domain-containing protein [Ignavibacteriota bacterium]
MFRLSLIALFVFTTTLFAQDVEHYFKFSILQKSELGVLTRIISIDEVKGTTVFAYANANEWEALLHLGYRPHELQHPGSEYRHEMFDSPGDVLEWDRYPTYQGYLAMMRQFAATYPNICKLDTFGYSVQGRQLLALKISDHVNAGEDEPEFLYTSSMHGDELVGYVLMLRLADYLLTQYGQQTPEGLRATSLVDNMEIWINPLANPDGAYRLGGDTTVSNARRYNANGYDLNRNFPDRIDDTVNTTAGRQTETRMFMEFTKKHNFILSANFHGGAQVVNYPWDNGTPSGTYSRCPDDLWFVNLSRKYSNPNPDMMNGGFTNGITNGCEWYAIYGGRQDWIYWWHGGRETTIELWDTKNPPGSVLPQRWTNNKESLLAYIEEALKGIRGVVRDSATRAPLRARVDVIDVANVPVFSDSTIGDYHRLLLPGTYSIIARAAGYVPDTARNVVVTNAPATRIDFALREDRPTSTQETRNVASTFCLEQNYPNPFNPTTTIKFQIPDGSGHRPNTNHVTLKVFDMLGREVATLVNEVKQPGTYTTQWDASRISGGVYFYRLHAGSFSQTRKLVIVK